MMRLFAGWSMGHRRLVVGLWVVVLVVSLVGLSGGVGDKFNDGSSLPGTGSQHANDLLSSRFPVRAGDADQIVFCARTGELSDPSVKGPVEAMLARVVRLPHVAGVISPYARSARAISPGGTIGFATVTFDEQADSLPTAAINPVIRVARSIRSPRL